MSWSIPRLFEGETVVVLAGGASLTAADVRQVALARFAGAIRVVAVNDAVYLAWWCDWLHGCDRKWWDYHQGAARFPGFKTSLDRTLPAEWGVSVLRNTGVDGFDPDPSAVRTGSNGAYQAIHSLIHAGARRIGLLGVDMQGGHWFGAHPPEVMRANPERDKIMVPHFATLLPTLKERGVEVVNCSPGSALATFPVAPLGEFLDGRPGTEPRKDKRKKRT